MWFCIVFIKKWRRQSMQKETLSEILNITHYYVSEIISENKTEIHLKLEKDSECNTICSGCEHIHKKGYHSCYEIIVEDLPICGRRVFLHICKETYRCDNCKKILVEKIDWIYIRCTRRYAKQVYRLTAITTNKESGWYLGIDDEVVYRIDKRMLQEEAKKKLVPIPAAIHISVDEVAYKKYHRYLTNVVDTDKKMIVWNEKGRKSEVLDKYYKGIGEENCKKIESVAMDGARTYISSTEKYAVNALIVIDRFHLMKKLNDAVDTVRKEQLKIGHKNEDEELIELTHCKQRFLLLKKKDGLTDKQKEFLTRLCKINEPIFKAMLLKESFLGIYECLTVEKANDYLTTWIENALKSELQVFKEIAKSFTDKFHYILNWFRCKISSAISEGINNKIKRLKRMAYGYKDIEYFKLKIHQHCGLLNPKLEVAT